MKTVPCPTCKKSASSLFICLEAGCKWAQKAGCEDPECGYFHRAQFDWRCRDGHVAKKAWSGD